MKKLRVILWTFTVINIIAPLNITGNFISIYGYIHQDIPLYIFIATLYYIIYIMPLITLAGFALSIFSMLKRHELEGIILKKDIALIVLYGIFFVLSLVIFLFG